MGCFERERGLGIIFTGEIGGHLMKNRECFLDIMKLPSVRLLLHPFKLHTIVLRCIISVSVLLASPPPHGNRRAPIPEAPGELRAALGAGGAGGPEGGGRWGAEPVGAHPASAAPPQLRPRSSSRSALRGRRQAEGAGPGRAIAEGVDAALCARSSPRGPGARGA